MSHVTRPAPTRTGPTGAPPPEPTSDHELIDRRLTALERLTRLAAQGAKH